MRIQQQQRVASQEILGAASFFISVPALSNLCCPLDAEMAVCVCRFYPLRYIQWAHSTPSLLLMLSMMSDLGVYEVSAFGKGRMQSRRLDHLSCCAEFGSSVLHEPLPLVSFTQLTALSLHAWSLAGRSRGRERCDHDSYRHVGMLHDWPDKRYDILTELLLVPAH